MRCRRELRTRSYCRLFCRCGFPILGASFLADATGKFMNIFQIRRRDCRDVERQKAIYREDPQALFVSTEFTLNVGKKACGFLQELWISGLMNLQAKPHTLSFCPGQPNQFMPGRVKGFLRPSHARKL